MKEENSIVREIDPIKENMLSVRAMNCCKSIGVTNMYDLQNFAKAYGLCDIHNCGRKTILELQEALNRFTYSESKYNSIKIGNIIHFLQNKLYKDIFETCIQNSSNDVKIVFMKAFPSINDFYTKIFENSSSVFINYNDVTPKTIFSCWQLVIKILEETNASMHKQEILDISEKLIQNKIEQCNKDIIQQLDEAKNSLLLSRISESLLDVLNHEFINIKNTLSARGKNVLDRENITYTNIYPFCSNTLAKAKNINHCGKKTAKEIIYAYSSFHNLMYNIASTNTVEQYYLITSSIFPFIKDEEIITISNFKATYGYYPIFKILSIYYNQTKERNDIIWDKANGITQPLIQPTNLAKEYNLTRERIRQLISKYKLKESSLNIHQYFHRENYPFINEDFINPKRTSYEIFQKEFSQLDYFTPESFIGMLSLYNEFQSIECGEEILLINKTIANSFDFKSSLADITKTISAKITEEIRLPINIFITNYVLNKTLDYDRIRTIIAYILKNIMNIELEKNYNLILKQNTIDIENEFYKILDTNGSPMSFDDLYLSLQKRYPKLSYATGTLRAFLVNSQRISPIGKSSVFSLNKWNISKLTIRGLIREILKQNENPLSLDDIVNCLHIKGRETTKKSVNTTIFSDEKCDYIKFKGGLIGLASKSYSPIFKPIDKNTISRKTFEERLTDYLNFVDMNHHIPFATTHEDEASLYRWYKNVTSGVLDVTLEQRAKLDSELLKRKEFVMTYNEYYFIEKCKDFKYYVSTEFDLPNMKADPSLYGWFTKARLNATEFTGKKKKAWDDLISFLSDYGFHID